ncbi:uncharacterized protein LOC144129907 [Amblyomma americanum]
MTSTTEPSSSFDSRVDTSADTCDTCATDGRDVERARPRVSRDRSLLSRAETGVAARYTLCCALASAVVAVVLLGFTGAVWYGYVVRPDMLLAPNGAPRSQEEQPKVLVVVVQATEGASTAATKPAFIGSGDAFSASAGTATASSSGGTGVAIEPQEEPLPAPL